MLFASSVDLQSFSNIYHLIDGIELRLDLSPHLHQHSAVLYTLRRETFQGTEEQREQKIFELLQHRPTFFDLEFDMRSAFLDQALQSFPETKFILSYHNFSETPQDLESLYQSMQRKGAYGYKIAAMTQSASDALRLLLLSKAHPDLSAIPMGEKGSFGRVLGPVVGNLIDYAYHGKPTASGQLSISEMLEIYRYRSLNPNTALYGLIGDPIEQSQGHLYHNQVFAQRKLNAVYVKMLLQPHELSTFFPLAQELGFKGLSVTMPLKEAVLPFLDEIPDSGAVNTIRFEQGSLIGTNTDGLGALDALGPVHNKRLVLLGAGGAARAIAFEAKKQGAEVHILNRTASRAETLAAALNCRTDLPPHYDVLINCSPQPIEIPLLPQAHVMDIVYTPKETPFLKRAKEQGCPILYGEEMFFAQAKRQTTFWLDQIFQIGPTALHFGPGLLQTDLLQTLCKKNHPVLIADETLPTPSLAADRISIPCNKEPKTLQYLLEKLLSAGYGRDTILLAYGGGTITDLIAFAASIYLRGVPLILIPTTLLGMVDASIGGKTAIDTPFGKNLIGSFYPPRAIVADPQILETLPKQEWNNGLSEIYKMALIQPIEPTMQAAIKAKISIVEQDPFETSLRRILNFGHTIGHALETATHYELSHGEAVAIGCMAESHLSKQLGYLQDFEQIRWPFSPRLPKSYNRAKLLEAMTRDKKKENNQIRFVLIDRIGHAISFDGAYCRPVSLAELTPTLDWMEQTYALH